mmetsp:Transcript_70083/g.146134  ORF Transcript_70083/g.146134 Transcript_70083/m.146134 type:complete len:218 (+) Transcript_70083:50-703(+)|eukprot:CAMPEP_0181322702 /NCGR_PEP_ID=MMETSP1101-20121128/19370_1 /TAXON_ID=46948 /ORGANISM="Rhodomonas abbreviata, Strain Caron Lab Isolate" /LENGTH=217 /DNA_ID=CAMNT_0023430635 /DNA_START=50 /DNA_END=703 /DNA_ORIENTATION=+
MGNVFGKEKPLKEIVRENQRLIKKSIRELEKEIRSLETQEKKLVADIKKSAKANQMGAVKIMAKDLVRTRNYVTRFIEMKTHLNAVSLKMQTVKSHDAMATAMKGVTKALGSMNKKINLPGLNKIMAEFMRENEKADMTSEMIGDTLDDAMEEEGSAEQEDLIVGQVLDELGINMDIDTPVAPVGTNVASAQAADAKAEEQADPAISDLEARLQNLK